MMEFLFTLYVLLLWLLSQTLKPVHTIIEMVVN